MKKICVLLLLIFVLGCAKKYTPPVEREQQPGEAMREEPMTEKPGVLEEEVSEDLEITRDDFISEEEITDEQLMAEEKARSVFKDVFFDYDRYDIKSDARPILSATASFLKDQKAMDIAIEGHCDERGTNEYNLALGEKRANAVKNYLVSLGVSPARIIVITYGEEKPSCFEQNETCWQNNRRAHFVLVK